MDALIVLLFLAAAVVLCRCWPRPDEDRASIDNWTRVRRELDREVSQ